MPIIDLSSLDLTPPVVSLGSSSINHIVSIVDSGILSKSELVVLTGIKNALDEVDSQYISASLVAKKILKGEQSVRIALKLLTKKGIFNEEGCSLHKENKRRASLFVFNPKYKTTPIQSNLLGKPDGSIFDLSYTVTNESGLADNLICRYLFVLLSYNHKSRASKNEGLIYVDCEAVSATAVSQSGQRLAQVKDLRYYIALLNICEKQMELRIHAEREGMLSAIDTKSTLFEVLEADLLTTAGLGKGSGERVNMNTAMKRLASTSYDIKNPSIKNLVRLGIKERNIKLNHFEIRDYIKTNDNKILYRIELSQKDVNSLYNYVIDQVEMFRETDPRIFSESNALRFAFMLWITHQPIGKSIQESWQTLKDAISPSKPILLFKKEMTKILEKSAVSYFNDETKKEDIMISYTKSGDIIESGRCEFNDISILLSVDDGFIITKKITKKLIRNAVKKERKIQLLDPRMAKNITF
jgi:hypothetical protein